MYNPVHTFYQNTAMFKPRLHYFTLELCCCIRTPRPPLKTAAILRDYN
uniref:Uncharacterized protein n=1 Tax=Anguilla anguilla TaxID=7936 RepID=A0A0E9ST25_ANGAN